MAFKVMTFNMHHGKGLDKRLDLNRIANLIAYSGADIIGLNEVDKHFSKRSLFVDQAAWLAKQLKLNLVFSPSLSLSTKHHNSPREYGNALLCKFPIMATHSHPLNFLKGPFEGRSLLEATLAYQNQSIKAFVTHLSLFPPLQWKQIDYISQHIGASMYPTILMGDFNMTPQSKSWRMLTGVLKDAWLEQEAHEHGFTYPAHRPRRRLDYIFCQDTIKINAVNVLNDQPLASDHLPLLSTLTLKS